MTKRREIKRKKLSKGGIEGPFPRRGRKTFSRKRGRTLGNRGRGVYRFSAEKSKEFSHRASPLRPPLREAIAYLEEELGTPYPEWSNLYYVEERRDRIIVIVPDRAEYTALVRPNGEIVFQVKYFGKSQRFSEKQQENKASGKKDLELEKYENNSQEVRRENALSTSSKLKFIKETAGLSIRELAEIFSVDEGTLGKWLKGEVLPSPEAIETIEKLHHLILVMEYVLPEREIKNFLHRNNSYFGRRPIELLKEGNWKALEKEFIAIAEGLPL